MGLISVAPTPWWIIPIELLMQGPSYTLSCVIIILFANSVSSSGISTSIQGIVGGIKEGFGKFSYLIYIENQVMTKSLYNINMNIN